MQSVQSAVDELNAQEENVMCAVTVYEDEAAGSQHIIINAMDSLQLQLSSYVNENNHACMDITLMTNSSESGEAKSWEDIYNAITSGENTEDLLLGVTIEITDSETVDALLYAFVDGAEWDVCFGVTGPTENYKNYAYLTVDPGMGLENGLFTLHMASIDLDSSLESMGIDHALPGWPDRAGRLHHGRRRSESAPGRSAELRPGHADHQRADRHARTGGPVADPADQRAGVNAGLFASSILNNSKRPAGKPAGRLFV